jgi:hypothetical protein
MMVQNIDALLEQAADIINGSLRITFQIIYKFFVGIAIVLNNILGGVFDPTLSSLWN